MRANEAGDYVSRCHTLASLLEVSAYPKPGNIHRTRDSDDTIYEHFLSGSVATAPVIRSLASRGFLVEDGKYEDLALGKSIFDAVKEMMKWQHGGNVQLGIILLHTPLAAAAGAVYNGTKVDYELLRTKTGAIIEKTKPDDTIKIFEAIEYTMPKRLLGKVEEMDISDSLSIKRIKEEEKTPLDVFKLCSDRDSICKEWTTNFEITFNQCYPFLKKLLSEGKRINEATIRTFLYILSEHPDSLILRKSGRKVAEKVSLRAKELLEISNKEEFNKNLLEMDRELWERKGEMNPGTTADIISASIFVLLLDGWRP
jgi:triphosphoribosyl-dephospho-CoA synthase